MKTRAKPNLTMIGLLLGMVCLVASQGQHSAAPAEQAQAAKAAETLVRAAVRASSASQDTAGLPQEPRPETSGPAGQEPHGAKYTGEPISLNLKEVDLKDFFRLIHEISGLNVIVDANVTGTLTLVLDDVPWDQALDIVLRDNGLSKVLEGNVLRIVKVETLTSEQDEVKKLKQAEEDAAPLVTVVRYLKYARAVDTQPVGGGFTVMLGAQLSIPGVVTVLKSMAATVLTRRGTVVADPRNNAVVITDVPKQIPIIQSIIDKLDRQVKQVSIEARIVLATNDFTRQLQTALNTQIFNHSGSVASGGVTGSGASATPTPQFTNPPPTSRFLLSPTSAAGFGAFAISNLGARYAINAAIAAAETRNLAKTISAPTIVTQDNVQGEVQQGTNIFIQTTINNTVTSVPYNATLTLDVTPHVTDEGNVFLLIKVKNDSPGPLLPGTQNPEINTQSATTQVLVPDGGTVIFGGIKVNSNTRSLQQVPGLGKIPVLGNLFKSTNREDLQNELLFFVTPKVLPG